MVHTISSRECPLYNLTHPKFCVLNLLHVFQYNIISPGASSVSGNGDGNFAWLIAQKA